MAECKSFPLIKAVRAYTVVPASDGDQGADCHDVDDKHWINGYPTPVANPMSGYALYKDTRKSWGINALGTLVVEVCNVYLLRWTRAATSVKFEVLRSRIWILKFRV